MPTRKITERERLTLYARTATDDELAAALEILNVEVRIRKGSRGGPAPKKAAKKPAEKVPGPPNPPKPDNDNPQG